MLLLPSLLWALTLTLPTPATTSPAPTAPTAKTLNGTYAGLHLPQWSQDAFLGLPYAQPPTGALRFARPRPLNTSFPGVREATTQGYSCMQYRGAFNTSEDCLHLNVVRPAAGTYDASEPLPVLVWLYGGGLYTGSVADPQYNLSGLVRVGQDMGRPVVAVAMNYRLGMWGFLQTPQVLAEGSSNAGLLDQRLALRWVRENIGAFGGDADRVVVWGESAGAQSIAYQMFGYGGRDEGLFRGAILESGGPTGAQVQSLPYYAAPVENLTRAVGCWDGVEDQLGCLRGLSQEELFEARPSQVWNPLVDGEFLEGYPSQLMEEGRFVSVPMLTGHNTDEGINFRPTTPKPEDGKDLADAFASWRSYSLSPPTTNRLLDLYPDDPCVSPPYEITNCSRFETLDRGAQWRRGATIGGDLVMIAGRRKMCELFTHAGQPVYSYRFEQRLWNRTEIGGVQHFDNVAFSFQNISGLLGPAPEFDSHVRLARAVGEAYVRFVWDLNPNPKGNGTGSGEGMLPRWPKYDLERPVNMVLNASGSYLEDDMYRREGMAFINSPAVARELLS